MSTLPQSDPHPQFALMVDFARQCGHDLGDIITTHQGTVTEHRVFCLRCQGELSFSYSEFVKSVYGDLHMRRCTPYETVELIAAAQAEPGSLLYETVHDLVRMLAALDVSAPEEAKRLAHSELFRLSMALHQEIMEAHDDPDAELPFAFTGRRDAAVCDPAPDEDAFPWLRSLADDGSSESGDQPPTPDASGDGGAVEDERDHR